MRYVALMVLGLIAGCGSEDASGRPKVESICTDSTDNDQDGRVDCDDQDCAAVSPCAAPPEVCGNNVREGEELCDGKDLAGHSCISRGFTSGTLRCDGSCAGFVTAGCTDEVPEVCGNQRDDDGDGETDCDDSDCANRPACMRVDEDCGAPGDEDGDGRADCADNDCAGEPACNGAEDCDNGVDDTDPDADADCDDGECASAPNCLCGNGVLDAGEQCDAGAFDVTCAELGFSGGTPTCVAATCTVTSAGCTGESCVDGADNDADDDIDCADSDCTAACATVCGAPATLPVPSELAGTTAGRALLDSAPSCAASAGAGPHIAYEIAPIASQRLRIAAQSDADVIVSLRGACADAASETQCVDQMLPGGTEEVFVDVTTTTPFVVLVGGFGAADAGAFTLEVSVVPDESACANLLDDDSDELVDCADPSCAATAACTPGSGAIGTPCEAATDCAGAPHGPLCFSEEQTGSPGGACAEFCEASADCGAGATCRKASGATLGVCFETCERDQDCRAGYVCLSAGASEPAVCTAYCTSDAQCSGDRVCNRGEFMAWCDVAGEACADGQDNDDDGLFDCDDQDCIDACDTPGLAESEINDSIAVADVYAAGFTAEINPAFTSGATTFFDVDVVSFVVPTGGGTVTVETDALEAGGCEDDTAPVDTVVALLNDRGEVLDDNDDASGVSYCSRLVRTLTEGGTYFVQVRPYYSPDAGYVAGPFGYALAIDVAP